jgi:hypothetical protein
MTRMTQAAGVLTMGLMLGAAMAARDNAITERKFVSGGTVRLNLSAGDYDIVASPDDRIRVTRTGRHADDDRVDVGIDVRGSRATVDVDGPLGDGVDARIELPRRTDVVISLSAGDLRMEGIEGSKDVTMRAGDLNIAVGAREQYRHVDASVKIGDLNAEPFDVRKEGFFRSFEWKGKGSYDISAHLMVGDLKLTR